jgi:hypothetical protein
MTLKISPKLTALFSQANRSVAQLKHLAKTAHPELRKAQPLSKLYNAHKTNTVEEMREGLAGNYGQMEGDIRQELNPPHALEMRHDTTSEPGDNLTLKEWLSIGKESGRLLKLDMKEPAHMARLLDEVAKANIPSEKLVFNLSDSTMDQWGSEIRKRFPDSRLAIGPDQNNPKMIERMIELGKRFGDPITFVLRLDMATPANVKKLEAFGPVSIWNMPEVAGVTDAAKTRAELQKIGCTGIVDIRPSISPSKPKVVASGFDVKPK